MRIRDALLLSADVRFGFGIETERTLIRSFLPSQMLQDTADFSDRALDPVLQFLAIVRQVDALPENVIEFLSRLRPIVGDRDFGIMSYSLGRALTGDVETCTARLLVTAFEQIERMISNNAAVFHADERLTPEDVLMDAVTTWHVRVGPIILAMIDFARQGGHAHNNAEDILFSYLTHDQVENIISSLNIVPEVG